MVVPLAKPVPDPRRAAVGAPVVREAAPSSSEAEETLRQLESAVSEFMVKYPSHTQRIPAIRPGEHSLVAIVRCMAASMAAKQEQLEKLNRKVLEAAREKERLLANMSHEVRTPMNGIFGMVNLLLEMDIDPVHRDYLETVQSASESLLNILDDILDYAKLNSKTMGLRPREFELAKLVREVLWTYKPTAHAKGLEISASICESLPESLVMDDLRLKQILSNLLSNAVKFTDSGRVSLEVEKVRNGARDQLLFRVSDTGIGIAKDVGDELFKPFQQIQGDSGRTFQGSGLGLAISRNLAELMGGRIWYESEAGAGTRFFLTADYSLPEPAPERPSPSQRPAEGPGSTPGSGAEAAPVRVLLVEDNQLNQKVAKLTLERLGCEVVVAGNGAEALEIAGGPERFDLICMDVNMPVMDGLAATAAIRGLDNENSRAHILAMTGLAFAEDRERCLASGMDDVVTKPFEIADLRERIGALSASLREEVALSS